MKDFQPFIYGLFDPTDPGHIRYVGMAMQPRRPSEHARRARRGVKHTYLLHWIRLIQSQGREPAVVVLEQFSIGASRLFVGQIERIYINSLRRIGHNLTNVSSGGWGGDCSTPESRAASAARMRLPRSAEYLANMSAAQKGKKGSEAQRVAVAKANALRVHSDNTREKLRAASLGNKHNFGKKASEETRAKISASVRAAFASGANHGDRSGHRIRK